MALVLMTRARKGGKDTELHKEALAEELRDKKDDVFEDWTSCTSWKIAAKEKKKRELAD